MLDKILVFLGIRDVSKFERIDFEQTVLDCVIRIERSTKDVAKCRYVLALCRSKAVKIMLTVGTDDIKHADILDRLVDYAIELIEDKASIDRIDGSFEHMSNYLDLCRAEAKQEEDNR